MGSGAFLVEACRQLGDALVAAWNAHGEPAGDPSRRGRGHLRAPARRAALPLRRRPQPGRRRPREDVALARRRWPGSTRSRSSTTRCATATRSSASPAARSSRSTGRPAPPSFAAIRIGRPRRACHRAAPADPRGPEETSDWALRDMWDEAQAELEQVRLFGDLAVAAFFAGAKPRRARRSGSSSPTPSRTGPLQQLPAVARRAARTAERPLVPFHWQIEFPEVFDRSDPGSTRSSATRRSPGQNTVSPTHSDRLPRLAEAVAPSESTATPTSSPTSSGAASSSYAARRDLRADRDQHDRPRRHPRDRAALDLHARRRDLRGPQAGQVAGARPRSS